MCIMNDITSKFFWRMISFYFLKYLYEKQCYIESFQKRSLYGCRFLLLYQINDFGQYFKIWIYENWIYVFGNFSKF